jgi:hypothetical protein
VRRDRAREHKRAHDLQHQAKVVFLAVVLVRRSACGFERVGQEDLNEPGAEFAGSGGDAMAGAAVAGGEDFGGDLLSVLVLCCMVVGGWGCTYDEGSDVWTEVECNVAQYVENNQA